MKIAVILALLLTVGGCKIEQAPPADRAAKVAAVISEYDITPVELAAYLAELGKTVVPSRLTQIHWSPSESPGDPVLYYQLQFAAARGDTAFELYFPDHAGAIGARVRAFTASGAAGPWSEWGYGLGDIFLGSID